MRLRVVLALVVVAALLVSVFSRAQGSMEFSVVRVAVPPHIVGSALALVLPCNLSYVYSERYVYVLSDAPVYYHVFSVVPPTVIVFEPFMSSERVYRVYSSFDNPYSGFSVSYTSGVFAAYDDFDYDVGMWFLNGSQIRGGVASVVGGWMALNTSIAQQVAVLFNIVGARGLRIDLPGPGGYVVTLTPGNFSDWGMVIDGSDIYFVDEQGRPVYYAILFFDKASGPLVAYVESTGRLVFMVYGGVNRYPEYRLFSW